MHALLRDDAAAFTQSETDMHSGVWDATFLTCFRHQAQGIQGQSSLSKYWHRGLIHLGEEFHPGLIRLDLPLK